MKGLKQQFEDEPVTLIVYLNNISITNYKNYYRVLKLSLCIIIIPYQIKRHSGTLTGNQDRIKIFICHEIFSKSKSGTSRIWKKSFYISLFGIWDRYGLKSWKHELCKPCILQSFSTYTTFQSFTYIHLKFNH